MNEVENIFIESDLKQFKGLINSLVRKINKNIKVELDTQYTSSMSEKIVYIGLLPLIQGFKSDKILEGIYQRKNIDYFDFHVFALLHEIGHIETTKHLNEIELRLKTIEYHYQVKELDKKCKNDIEFLDKYLELDLEVLANNWAIDYIKNNRKELESFREKFYNTLDKMVENILAE